VIVIDTNLFSEYMSARPAPEVEAWRATVHPADVHITTITRAEVRQGVGLLPDGRRRDVLEERAERALVALTPRTLPFDNAAADRYGEIVARWVRFGRPITALDAQIAAIALAHHAAVATRDVGRFADTGVRVIDPWNFSRG